MLIVLIYTGNKFETIDITNYYEQLNFFSSIYITRLNSGTSICSYGLTRLYIISLYNKTFISRYVENH